ncbi:MAG: GntR family transcriptional regulator [Rhizobiales bacterium]|nr:GntR family transcriptional regulator [Hyphomicrobiales bacterium]
MSKLLKAYDRSRIPLYIQVASVMRQRIDSQQWLPGQKISTLVELEREFEVARVTVRQAVDILCEEGLLQCQQGRGTFVSEKPPDRHWLKLATEWDLMIASIKDNVPRRIRVDNPPPFPDLRDGEGKLAHEYKFLRSVQFKETAPYGIVSLHLARSVFERDPEAFLEHPALSVLAQRDDIDVRHAHQTVVIGAADPETADYLKIALGAPTAQCRCVVIDAEGVAIYVADITYRSDAIKLHIDLLANSRAGKPRANVTKPNAERAVAGLRSAEDVVMRGSRRARLSS